MPDVQFPAYHQPDNISLLSFYPLLFFTLQVCVHVIQFSNTVFSSTCELSVILQTILSVISILTVA